MIALSPSDVDRIKHENEIRKIKDYAIKLEGLIGRSQQLLEIFNEDCISETLCDKTEQLINEIIELRTK